MSSGSKARAFEAGYTRYVSEPKAPKDVVLPFAPTEDGKGVRVLRAREDRVEAGEVRPIVDGQPLHGELVRLTPREDAPALCDVTVLHDAKGDRSRPSQVATNSYRQRWTEIFGDKSEPASISPPGSKSN